MEVTKASSDNVIVRIHRRIVAWLGAIASANVEPSRLFLACVVGGMVGCTPWFGAHIFVCAALARVLRLNLAAMYGAANVSIPPMVPLIGVSCVTVGAWWTHTPVPLIQHFDASAARASVSVFVLWTAGAPIVGGVVGAVIGGAVAGLAIARKVRALSTASPRIDVVAIDGRFAAARPWIRSYVRWKLRLDPVYGAIDALTPADAKVLDLGCGHGLLGIVLTLADPARIVRGVEWDEAKARDGRAASVGLSASIDVGDLRTWALDGGERFDVVAIVDVLHALDEEAQRSLLGRAVERLSASGALVIREGERRSDGSAWTEAIEKIAARVGWNRSSSKPRWLGIDALIEALAVHGLTGKSEPLAGPLHPGNVLVVARRAPLDERGDVSARS